MNVLFFVHSLTFFIFLAFLLRHVFQELNGTHFLHGDGVKSLKVGDNISGATLDTGGETLAKADGRE